MHRALLVLLLLGAFAAGVLAAGLFGDRSTRMHRADVDDEVRRVRPSALRDAWRAFERDQFDKLDEAFARLREHPPTEPEFQAEVELLVLLRAGDRGALLAFADRNQQWPAGASALEQLIATSTTEAERAEHLARLRVRYPRTWRGEARTK